MKRTTCISICLVGALLQGCGGGPAVIESDVAGGDEAQEASSEPEAVVDAKIAALDVPGGQVLFVDEGLTEPGGGIAFWEIGDVDLSYLLEHENATALEVFLALAPEGMAVPERLLEHHAEAARRVGGISVEPRHLAASLALPELTFLTNEGLNDGGSGADKSCWGWGGTSAAYSEWKGFQSFDYQSFQSSFNSTYSQISGVGVSSGFEVAQSYVDYYSDPTTAGHERAMAFCLSKAIPIDTHNLGSDCGFNRGSAVVVIKRSTDSTYSGYVTADSIALTAFGHGARFRSNYTNSGGGARKYMAELQWPNLPEEEGFSVELSCRDELVIAWRSKWIPPYINGG